MILCTQCKVIYTNLEGFHNSARFYFGFGAGYHNALLLPFQDINNFTCQTGQIYISCSFLSARQTEGHCKSQLGNAELSLWLVGTEWAPA